MYGRNAAQQSRSRPKATWSAKVGTKPSRIRYAAQAFSKAAKTTSPRTPAFTGSLRKKSRNLTEYMFAVRGTATAIVRNVAARS